MAWLTGMGQAGIRKVGEGWWQAAQAGKRQVAGKGWGKGCRHGEGEGQRGRVQWHGCEGKIVGKLSIVVW